MNHQPFRGWLLSEQELTIEQAKALKEHLSACDACCQIETSWKELELAIKRSPELEPAPGFVDRWQAHLVNHQMVQQKRKGWYTIGATSLITTSLLTLVVIQVWSLIQSPSAHLAAWFDRLVGLVAIFFTIQNIVSAYSLPSPVYTLVGGVFLLGMISFMSVLWLATYRRISMVRRVI